MSEITDEKKWRLSKSGFSIKIGWGYNKVTIEIYPGREMTIDRDTFKAWMENAELICYEHNKELAQDETKEIK